MKKCLYFIFILIATKAKKWLKQEVQFNQDEEKSYVQTPDVNHAEIISIFDSIVVIIIKKIIAMKPGGTPKGFTDFINTF